MSAGVNVLTQLIEANKRHDKAAVLALLTQDVEYHYHVGSKPLVGIEKVAKFLDKYWGFASDPNWRIDRHAQNGDKLLVEGSEEYTDTRTGVRLTTPYMGIFEFRDGKIARWRDYFEMKALAGNQ